MTPGRAMLCAVGAVMLWSSLAFLSVRLAAVPPFKLVGLALLLGALCGLPRIAQWRASGRTLALGVYGLFAYHFCLFMALRRAPVIEANLINYLWPLLIVLLTPLVLAGYRLNARHVLAGLLGFAGAALLVTGGRLQLDWAAAPGYALALAAALIWSTYSLLTKRYGGFPNAVVGLFCLVSGALSLACHWLLEPAHTLAGHEIAPLLALGLGPMGAAFYLWDAALKAGDPRSIGSLAYLTPLASTLLLALSGAGALSALSLAAMALIITGAALGAWASGRRSESNSRPLGKALNAEDAEDAG